MDVRVVARVRVEFRRHRRIAQSASFSVDCTSCASRSSDHRDDGPPRLFDSSPEWKRHWITWARPHRFQRRADFRAEAGQGSEEEGDVVGAEVRGREVGDAVDVADCDRQRLGARSEPGAGGVGNVAVGEDKVRRPPGSFGRTSPATENRRLATRFACVSSGSAVVSVARTGPMSGTS